MSSLQLSPHVEMRMRQRGLRDSDLVLAMEVASAVSDDVWFVTDEDVSREISCLKQRLQRIERLRGMKVVVSNDTVVTAYRSTSRDRRRTFRHGREAK